MSVVSGIATLNGAASQSGGKSVSGGEPKARARDAGPAVPSAALRIDASLSRIVERLGGASALAGFVPSQDFSEDIVQGSGRYMRFVDAVQALRLNTADAAELPPARVEQLREAAKEVFDIHTGIPREQRPSEVFEEQRLQEMEREARARAAEAEAVEAESDAKGEPAAPVDGTEADPATSEAARSGSAPELPKAAPVTSPAAPDTGSSATGAPTRPGVPDPSIPEPATPAMPGVEAAETGAPEPTATPTESSGTE